MGQLLAISLNHPRVLLPCVDSVDLRLRLSPLIQVLMECCEPTYHLPGNCDECGTTNFTIEHALDCRFGGLVTRQQKDAFGDLVSSSLESRAPGTSV